MHHTHPAFAASASAVPPARPTGRGRLAFATLLLLALVVGPSRPAGAADRANDDYPGAGTLLLGPRDAGVEALLLDTRLALDVRGLLGELTLTQTFRNTTGEWLDGTYLFPLPEAAAVRGLELAVGERSVVGRIMETTEARETFERARDAGQVAGLVEQRRPNLFTARLASVPPGGEIHVALDILLPVRASDERLSLVLPTTLTPRYANAHARDADELDAPILDAREIAGPRFTLEASLRPLDDLSLASSESHRLSIENGRLVIRDAPMDRDLEIAWPFAGGTAPSGEAFTARHGGERYVQLFMAPPAASPRDGSATARELVLVVDTSGSMAGAPMEAAREAAQSALDGLGPDDAFDLIAFDDRTRALFDGPRPATVANLAAARRFVRRLAADGGTEMAPALARAFSPARLHERGATPEARLRQVVFLTDGSIADEERLLRLIRRDAGDARLFTVGIGAAPNRWFLGKAAELGRGTALAIRDVDDVRDAVTALLGRLERPVLTDIEVRFPDGGGESYPARVPDLYADSPLMVVARLDGAPATDDGSGGTAIPRDGVAIVTGRRGDERFVRRIPLTASTAPSRPERSADAATGSEAVSGAERRAGGAVEADTETAARAASDGVETPGGSAPALAMHWARAKVATLLDEQRESGDAERHRDAIVALALDTGLVTPYTSFVAVEATPVRPDGAARANADVANRMPHGNEMATFGLPRGAAGIDTLGLLGLLAGALGAAMLRWERRLARNVRAELPS